MKKLREECLAYVAKSYPEWPESYEGSHCAVCHCGYSWEHDKTEAKHWQLVNRESGDIIVQNDVVAYRADFIIQEALPVGEVFFENEITEQASHSGLDFKRIGNKVVGEELLVITTALGNIMSFLLVRLSGRGAYRRAL